jgi:zona occludens toxin (predicted ATPase)
LGFKAKGKQQEDKDRRPAVHKSPKVYFFLMSLFFWVDVVMMYYKNIDNQLVV